MIRRIPGVALYAQLADLLRDQIEDGTYGPGAMLPSEEQLSDSHEVSRNTVRRATALLTTEGLIEARPGYGTRVVVPVPEEDLAVVALQRGSRCRIRRATRAERIELGIEPGVQVLEVRLGSRTKVYAGDRSLFTIA